MAEFFDIGITFTYTIVNTLNAIWLIFTTPLDEIGGLLPPEFPSFIGDVLSSLLALFGDIALVDIMFGGALIIFVLYTLYKWVL